MNPTTRHYIAATAATAASHLINSRPLLRTTYSVLHLTFQLRHGAPPPARLIPTCPKASAQSYRFYAPPRHPRSGYYGATLLAATAVGLLTPTGIEERPKGVLEEAGHSGKDVMIASEQRMLGASKQEKQEGRREYTRRLWRTVVVFYSDWIYEPIATTLRFLRLVVIFVPVLATIPIMFVGGRVPEKSNERIGTLWWYAFLVNSMEKAGPTFIKVCQPYLSYQFRVRKLTELRSSASGPPPAQISSPPKCVSSCPGYTPL